MPVLTYSVIGVGGVFSATSPASTAGELSKQLQGARAKILVTSETTRATAVQAAEIAGWGWKWRWESARYERGERLDAPGDWRRWPVRSKSH